MKPQQFAALAAAALASLVLAVAAYTAAAPWQAAISQGKLFPGFSGTAAKISRIQLSQGKTTLELERKGDVWTLKDRDGLPSKQRESARTSDRTYHRRSSRAQNSQDRKVYPARGRRSRRVRTQTRIS